jgi:hypothetical protein
VQVIFIIRQTEDNFRKDTIMKILSYLASIQFHPNSFVDYSKKLVYIFATSTFTQVAAALTTSVILFNSRHIRHYRPDNCFFCSALLVSGTTIWLISKMCWTVQCLPIEKSLSHLARFSLVNTLSLKLNHTIHEWGHAGAALTLFRKAQPIVTAHTFFGHTEYSTRDGLVGLGKCLGKERAKLCVTAAGLSVPILSSVIELAIAKRLNHYPKSQHLLCYHAISQLAELFFYGLSAFYADKTRESHDFIHLWKRGGIHPIIPLTIIVVLPLTEAIFLHYDHMQMKKTCVVRYSLNEFMRR